LGDLGIEHVDALKKSTCGPNLARVAAVETVVTRISHERAEGDITMKTTIKALTLIGVGMAFAIAGTVQSQDASAAKFLTTAIQGNMAEVKMGELAQKRGKSEDVRDFGETLVTDHGKGLQKSSSLAKSLGIMPPAQPTADAQKMYDAMSKLSGDEFDKQFAMHMVMDHQKDIAAYQAQARDAASPEVAAFAKETLPTLEKHLKAAQSIEKDKN
jgi:putative membrane protein